MFRDRLKELRKAFGVSQEELASIIGVERSSIGKYESPKSNIMPSYDVLARLADYFGVSIDYLLERDIDTRKEGVAFRISVLAKYHRIALVDLAKKLNMTYAEMYEKLFTTPDNDLIEDTEFLKKVAVAIDVDVNLFYGYNTGTKSSFENYINYLLCKVDSGDYMTAKESSILADWINGKYDETDTDDMDINLENILSFPQMRRVPLIGTIACGTPILAIEDFEETVNMPEDVRADFALLCKGDSMINARIHDGDIAYIRQQPNVENGQIAAVQIDDEVTLKRVYFSGNRLVLQPENPIFQPLIFVDDEITSVRILGLAVAFTSVII